MSEPCGRALGRVTRVGLLGVVWLGLAHAHGPAPAPLEVLALDAEGVPAAVRTSIGLATRWHGGARYLCAEAWSGDFEAPAMAALPDGRLVVAGRGGPMLGDVGGCAFAPVTGWTGDRVDALVGGADGVWIVGRTGGRARVDRVGRDGVLEAVVGDFGGGLDSVAVDAAGAVWLASGRPTPRIGRLGEGLVAVAGPLAAADFLDLRAAGDRLFVVASVGSERVLAEYDGGGWTERVRIDGRDGIHGPVAWGADRVAVIAGTLARQRPEGSFEASLAGEVGWTCLQRVNGRLFACATRVLVRLEGDPDAPVATPVWAMGDLLGVDPACPADARRNTACEQAWLHFGAEAGLYRFDAGVAAAPVGAGGDTGCAVGGRAGGLSWGLVLLFVRRNSLITRMFSRGGPRPARNPGGP